MSEKTDELIDIVLNISNNGSFVIRSLAEEFELLGKRKNSAKILKSTIDNLESELATLKEANRWIPVSERLPEIAIGRPHTKLEVVTERLRYFEEVAYVADGKWNYNIGHDWVTIEEPVMKWRPLPPEVEE